ncbi:E3 ubiquitin-protein ligase COP1 [Gracilariopsis chorda]|uniref:E3 ubiquitin-protein ligase COP1 n=1 Tax=Gracilariopsis chorda TaxID=448386 RepID=A0A2V3IX56_9FLOR|nr:E3 ubiquitin-protein ligase COP1 [Gracilariopsis chorda]|eukprot:PXF45720.1 E3 ubiquitin-protein ligase COP1 [Gracilariopsis chorda]
MCAAPLHSAAQLHPSRALDVLARSAVSDAPPLDVSLLDDPAADALLAQLVQRRCRRRQTSAALAAHLLLPFLARCRAEKRRQLSLLQRQLRRIHLDISHLRTTVKPTQLPCQPLTPTSHPPLLRDRARLLQRYHPNVRDIYLRADHPHQRHANPLNHVSDLLLDATSITSVQPRATISNPDILANTPTLVTSIQFNQDASIFATASVSKTIKLFDFASLLNQPNSPPSNSHHYPILRVPTPSKISCLAWISDPTSQLAASMYNGSILLHDVHQNKSIRSLNHHNSTIWGIHSTSQNPTQLISASHDKSVAICDTRQFTPIHTIHTPASVCCVKFNPFDAHHFAFGSADHTIYYYDTRQMNDPLSVFNSHSRAVSQLLFQSRTQLVSASIDASCKLWDVHAQSQPLLTYEGHCNRRNFVGLCGDARFFACGSEDNSVYVYNTSFCGPVVTYPFAVPGAFVSSVAWKPHSRWLVAANNTGTVQILELL